MHCVSSVRPAYKLTKVRICYNPCFHSIVVVQYRWSLDSDLLATLVYAVVNSRIDYCNTVLAGAPRTVTDNLQSVLALGSLTAAWVRYCMMNFTGSTSPTGCSSSWHCSSSVSERPRTTVLVGLLPYSLDKLLLCPGRQCCHSAASAFRQSSATCSTSLPPQHIRLPCIFSCRPNSLELSPGFHPGPDHQCRAPPPSRKSGSVNYQLGLTLSDRLSIYPRMSYVGTLPPEFFSDCFACNNICIPTLKIMTRAGLTIRGSIPT